MVLYTMNQFISSRLSSTRTRLIASSTLIAGGSLLLSFIVQEQQPADHVSPASCCEQTSQKDADASRKQVSDKLRIPEQQQLLSSSPAPKKTTRSTIPRPRLVFLGTGSSTGCPRPLCPMVFGVQPECKEEEGKNDDDTDHEDSPPTTKENNINYCNKSLRDFLAKNCVVSNLAMQGGDPRQNRNYRNNPSLLISHYIDDEDEDDNNSSDGGDQKVVVKNIVIDVGKTFRETALRWFPIRGIHSLDAIILTHEHADAVFGLDDIRGFQKWQLVPEDNDDKHNGIGIGSGSVRPEAIPMEIHLSQHCLGDMRVRFPWLFPMPKESSSSAPPAAALARNGQPIIQRHVASFDVRVFEPLQPFVVQGLSIVALPVMHGEDLVSMGYAFTLGRRQRRRHDEDTDQEDESFGGRPSHRRRPTNVVYLSDISRMLPETMDYIQNKLPPTDILILDALHPLQTNPTHFNLVDAVELVQQIKPKQVYLVGMSCDSYLPHDEMNDKLLKEYGNIQLAHDGLEIEC